MRSNSLIGSPVERVEDLRFLRGRGEYVGDVTRSAMLHATILRSPQAHGRIVRVDPSRALALPGVHAVLTASDVGPVPTIPLLLDATPDLQRFQQTVIAGAKVRYVGEPIAVVVAESRALAEDAAELVEIEISPLPAVAGTQTASEPAPLLFDEHGTNLAGVFTAVRGDAQRAFADAPYTRRETFRVHRHTAMPMEPRGIIAEWDDAAQRMTVWGATKAVFANRRILARLLGLAPEAIRMIENDVGGAFGMRGEFHQEDFLIPLAALRLRRPVQWIEDRGEHFQASHHARDVSCDLELACTRDGAILAMRGRAVADMGAYVRTVGATPARNVVQVLSGPYAIPHIDVEIALQLTNKTPVGTYRGPGRFEADFFRERLLDLVAADLGLDRAEFRRRNLIAASQMPYRIATVMPLEIVSDCDSGDYGATLKRCLAEIKWSDKAHLNGTCIDGAYHGLGLGCYIEAGGAGPRENARLALESDGTVSIFVGSSAHGQSLETTLSQIAADALEIPMSRIRGVFHGSTDYIHDGYGSFASRATVMGGSAVLAAAMKLREAISAAAARRFGCEPDVVSHHEGTAVGPDGRVVRWAELSGDGLAGDGTFECMKRTFSYGCHAAHVAVDPATGRTQVIDYVAVEDVGRVVNPLTLKGQVVGAIVQGLGGVFLEELVYDEAAQLLTGTLADYLLPTATDFPVVRAVALEDHPSPNNPLGAKGAGEGGIIPVAGVIGNAVASALRPLGACPRDLPLSPPRVWALVAEASAGNGAARQDEV